MSLKSAIKHNIGENCYSIARSIYRAFRSVSLRLIGLVPRRSNRKTVLKQCGENLLLLYKDSNDEAPVIANGDYEPTIMTLLAGMINQNDCVLDVGANCGLHTVSLSRLCGPHGRVHAFEPVDYNVRKLKTNLVINGCRNTSLHPYALGASDCWMDFHQIKESDMYKGNSSLVENEKLSDELSQNFDVVKVPVRSLDSVVEELEIDEINLIKMDVEGFEFQVLLGAQKTLKRCRPAIILEYHSSRLKHLNLTNHDFKELLGEEYYAYEICVATAFDRYPSLEPFHFDRDVPFGNIVLIPKCRSQAIEEHGFRKSELIPECN